MHHPLGHLGVAVYAPLPVGCQRAEALFLDLPCADDALSDDSRRLARLLLRQLREGHGLNLTLNVYSVEQRATDFVEIFAYLTWGALAWLCRMSVVTAGARVHRGHEHHIARIVDAVFGSRDGDLSILKRLTQHLESGSRKLWEFVEKEYTIMGQTDLTGHGVGTTTHECHLRHGVVRGLEGPLCDEACAALEFTCHGVNLSCLEALGQRQWRKYAREAPGQHTFAGTWGPHHEQVVAASRRHLQRTLYALLPSHVGKVQFVLVLMCKKFGTSINYGWFEHAGHLIEELHHLLQIVGAIDLQLIHHGRLTHILPRHYQTLIAHLARLDGNRQSTSDGLQGAVEAELSEHHKTRCKLRVESKAIGQEYTKGYGQVEARAFLANISRREIHYDVLGRQFHPAVLQGRINTAEAFLDAVVRKANDCHAQSKLVFGSCIHVNLDGHGNGCYTGNCCTKGFC